MVGLITFFFLLVRLVTAWRSAKEESTGGERGLKGMGEGEVRKRVEELSRREVERQEEIEVEEWQKRMQYDGGGAETKPKVSFSVSSTLEKQLQEERRLHNTNPGKAVELSWSAGPTVGDVVPILPKSGAEVKVS